MGPLQANSHDESKLPKWAQELIQELRHDNATLARTLETTRAASALTCEPHRKWFTIPGPKASDPELDEYRLWFLGRNQPIQVCTLYKNDLLLVGRAHTGHIDKVQQKYKGGNDGKV
jgi:hypothetical protein